MEGKAWNGDLDLMALTCYLKAEAAFCGGPGQGGGR